MFYKGLVLQAQIKLSVLTSIKSEALGKIFGMTHFVNPSEVEGDLVPYLVSLTDDVDYSFECIGNVEVTPSP